MAKHMVTAKLLALNAAQGNEGKKASFPGALPHSLLLCWTLLPHQSPPGLQASNSQGTPHSICTSHFGH